MSGFVLGASVERLQNAPAHVPAHCFLEIGNSTQRLTTYDAAELRIATLDA